MVKIVTTLEELEEAGRLKKENPDAFQIKSQIIDGKVEYALFTKDEYAKM